MSVTGPNLQEADITQSISPIPLLGASRPNILSMTHGRLLRAINLPWLLSLATCPAIVPARLGANLKFSLPRPRTTPVPLEPPFKVHL